MQKTVTRRTRRPALIEGRIARIPLGVLAKDGYAIVDGIFADLSKDNWRLTTLGYVIRSKDKKLLHRVITDAKKHYDVDHRNHNKLDNRLENIRVCTHAENSKNQLKPTNNTSGYKGVYWNKRSGKWLAAITVQYKQIYIGVYCDIIEAAKAYNAKAVELHGEYAEVNRGI